MILHFWNAHSLESWPKCICVVCTMCVLWVNVATEKLKFCLYRNSLLDSIEKKTNVLIVWLFVFRLLARTTLHRRYYVNSDVCYVPCAIPRKNKRNNLAKVRLTSYVYFHCVSLPLLLLLSVRFTLRLCRSHSTDMQKVLNILHACTPPPWKNRRKENHRNGMNCVSLCFCLLQQ